MRVKTKTKGGEEAQKLLQSIGVEDLSATSIELLISWLDAILIKEPLQNSDGRIIQGKTKSIIKINSTLARTRQQFAIAHEIGHLIMHKGINIHNENSSTLNWFQNIEKSFKAGEQELEANEFAVELLMPAKVFYEEAKGKPFSPSLLKKLSTRFQTSISSVALRYSQFKELHPICVVFTSDNKVRYWSKSEDLKVKIKNIIKLPPPPDSIAEEYIKANYAFIYKNNEEAQDIEKSIWFELWANEEDTPFYEYCIPTLEYKSVMSIIWED